VEVGEESEELQIAWERYQRAVREEARAAFLLGNKLRLRGEYGVARQVLQQALDLLDEGSAQNDEDFTLLAAVLFEAGSAAMQCNQVFEARGLAIRGLRLIEGLGSEKAKRRRVALLSMMPGPYGRDHGCVRQAIAAAELGKGEAAVALISHMSSLITRGDYHGAQRSLQAYLKIDGLAGVNLAIGIELSGNIYNELGSFLAAEESGRKAADLYYKIGSNPASACATLAWSLYSRGELDAARRALEANPSADPRLLARLDVDSGDIVGGLSALRTPLTETLDRGADRSHYLACVALIWSLIDAYLARRLSVEDLIQGDADIEDAEELSRAAFGADPPWYTIFFPLRRSELLAIRPDRITDALSLSLLALDRARASCEEIIPEAARIHGHQHHPRWAFRRCPRHARARGVCRARR